MWEINNTLGHFSPNCKCFSVVRKFLVFVANTKGFLLMILRFDRTTNDFSKTSKIFLSAEA